MFLLLTTDQEGSRLTPVLIQEGLGIGKIRNGSGRNTMRAWT